MVALANVALIHSVKGFGLAFQLGAVLCNLELYLLVNEEGTKVAVLVYLVVFPECVSEEGFQHIMLVKATSIKTVHQIGIVKQYTRWFLGELVAFSVNHVY